MAGSFSIGPTCLEVVQVGKEILPEEGTITNRKTEKNNHAIQEL